MKPIRRPLPQSDSDDDDEYEQQEQYEDDDDEMEYDDDNEEQEDDDDEEDEEDLIKQQLSNVSFSTLLKYKKNGPTTKLNLNTMVNDSNNKQNVNSKQQQKKEEILNSKNKYNIKREKSDAPVEMTAMKPVSRFKQIVPNKNKLNVRDPRFDSLSGGKFDEDLHRKRYGFLDDVIKRDIIKMESIYDEMNEGHEKDQLLRKIQSKKSQLRAQEMKDQKRETRNKLVAREVDSVKKGKAPYHITNKAIKQFEIQEKFKQLKASNKLDKFMEKRRKKISSKEKTFLPRRRSHDDQE